MRNYIDSGSADAHKCTCRELDALGRVMRGIGSAGFSDMGMIKKRDDLCSRIFTRVETLVDDLEGLDGTSNNTDD